ncbi:MAG: glutamine-hydrolyzing GMP synthase [Candidatus Sumerlaeota bacterium]|nr:glutamine-hydrolyzing GMP synthase [Candidatus Sumerlaeota bacterium]
MILVLDFGSQYTQLIARKIRTLRVYSEIVPYNTPLPKILAYKPSGVILSGGPANVYVESSPTLPPDFFGAVQCPVLGICYGLQLIAHRLGGKVEHSNRREYGHAELKIDDSSGLFKGIEDESRVWMSHQDRVTHLPEDFVRLAHTSNSEFCAIGNHDKRIYGLQFHPEVHHTVFGHQILENFAVDICADPRDWQIESFIEKTIRDVRAQVGSRQVLCGTSGGVDSTVLSVLLHRAIGDQLHCVFIDNGVMRHNEGPSVLRDFKELRIKLHYIDATTRFLNQLEGVLEPEEKRRRIGKEFVDVFFQDFGEKDFLAQGTLYPDVIESVSTKGPSATIKTHHNRVERILELIQEGRVIEPFKELFKDEVRSVGKELGIPDKILWRQPFPGPGLAVRILGEVTPERLELLRKADWIVIEEMKKADLYYKIWQSFAVLMTFKSVGVMGDERTYEHAVAIRAVQSVDGMTADWANLPHELLARISNRIINEVKGINRVVYDISSKPPSTIEWE